MKGSALKKLARRARPLVSSRHYKISCGYAAGCRPQCSLPHAGIVGCRPQVFPNVDTAWFELQVFCYSLKKAVSKLTEGNKEFKHRLQFYLMRHNLPQKTTILAVVLNSLLNYRANNAGITNWGKGVSGALCESVHTPRQKVEGEGWRKAEVAAADTDRQGK
eukprot:1797802-Amphidinium_carterae.3